MAQLLLQEVHIDQVHSFLAEYDPQTQTLEVGIGLDNHFRTSRLSREEAMQLQDYLNDTFPLVNKSNR